MYAIRSYYAAQFGNVNNYQYWFVDAKAIFPTAVPVVSGIGMYGFGGGAWYHMRKSSYNFV